MSSSEIDPNDLQVLRLLDDIAGRFEIDAGFPLPGISPQSIPKEYAASFGIEEMSAEKMADLARIGLLAAIHADRGGTLYTLTDEAERIVRSLQAA